LTPPPVTAVELPTDSGTLYRIITTNVKHIFLCRPPHGSYKRPRGFYGRHYSERGDARAVLAIVLNLFTHLAILFVAMFLHREPVELPARRRNAPVT